jgi:hypothetical protein
MELRALPLTEKPSYWEKSIEVLEERGIRTITDWETLSPEDLIRLPLVSRKLRNLIQEAIDTQRAQEANDKSDGLHLWNGRVFNDDRLFILDMQIADKGGDEVWAVVTRWNHNGFPPYKVNDFPTQMEAIQFIKKIEPQTPRISLGGKSPSPVPSYIENLAILRANGEQSAYAIYETNKHQERKLILQAMQST